MELSSEDMKEMKPLAVAGTRCVLVIAKITGQKRYDANAMGPAQVVCPAVVGEGTTWNLSFAADATVPGRGFEGVFVVDPSGVYKGKSGVSIPCLGFS